MHASLMPALVALASAALVSGCAGVQHAAAPDQAQTYTCESGAEIVASYPSTETATIRYQGAQHEMAIAVSASGARYVGDGLEWWTKGSGSGSEGTLLEHLADGTSGDVLENCTAS